MSADVNVKEFLQRAQRVAKDIEPFGKSVLFDFGEHGKVFADATSSPVTFEHGVRFDQRASCLVKTQVSILQKLIKGELDPMSAMFSGRLKIRGDMNAALELAKRLRAVNA